MRIAAILANVILLILFAPMLTTIDLAFRGIGIDMIIAAIVAPLLSMIALMLPSGSIFELISLEIEARKATLRQRIAEREAKSDGNGIRS